MLIKEYRICLPVTVAEYRIAQLYMIQKKSREESTGQGSGVEIIENRPYENGPGGTGQYTFKIYHVASHLPAWIRGILPPSALRVEEEAWNAYPYTRTIYRVPFVDKMTLDIETYYFDDNGGQDDVFQLTPEEKNMRIVDYIDIVLDPIPKHEYKPEEDPLLYVSQATGRGPLTKDWRQSYYHAQSVTHEAHTNPPSRSPDNNHPGPGPLTPLPKRIMCAYKLCRVEFRYWGMQRKVEQFIQDSVLRKTMVRAHRQVWTWQDEWYGLTIEEVRRLEDETAKALASKMAHPDTHALLPNESPDIATVADPTVLGIRANSSEPALADSAHKTLPESLQDIEVLNVWTTLKRLENNGPEMAIDDAASPLSEIDDDDTLSFVSCRSHVTGFTSYMSAAASDLDWFGAGGAPECAEDLASVDACPPLGLQNSRSPGKLVLLLVVHGGYLLDSGTDSFAKEADFQTLSRTIGTVLSNHYPILRKQVAIRLVPCPPVLTSVFQSLINLKPDPVDPSLPPEIQLARDVLPFGTIPFLLTTCESYAQLLQDLTSRLNSTYSDFLQSPEGHQFRGFVCLLADSVGSLLVYDLLNRTTQSNGCCVDMSVTDAGIRRWREPTTILANGQHEFEQPPVQVELETSSVAAESPSPTGAAAPSPDPLSTHRQSYQLSFPVQTFFMLGSPVALVLALRRQLRSLSEPGEFNPESRIDPDLQLAAEQVYNLFHSSDPCAYRLEPLLHPQFSRISPVYIPPYAQSPLGDVQHPSSLIDTLVRHANLFSPPSSAFPESSGSTVPDGNRNSLSAQGGQAWQHSSRVAFETFKQVRRYWWGQQRIDYSLQCPDGLRDLITHARPAVFHASYWESKDVAAFLMRQLLSILGLCLPETSYSVDADDDTLTSSMANSSVRPSPSRQSPLTAAQIGPMDGPRLSRMGSNHSSFKSRLRFHVSDGAKTACLPPNLNAKSNHRGNDLLVLESDPQIITARFVFGLLDLLSMSNEKIFVQARSANNAWIPLGEDMTDSSGRIHFRVPDQHRFGIGLHMVVLTAETDPSHPVKLTLAVVPPRTEAVVFSVDGSFAASLSIMGKDPKVRPGSVDVVRHWQNLGYLIIYLSARPDMQKRRVTSWLTNHNFPLGTTLFVEGISTDPLRQKAQLLRSVVQQVQLHIHCAYGSGKDVQLYRSLGLGPLNIFVVGRRVSRNQAMQSTPLTQGYASHLARLRSGDPVSKPASGTISASVRCSQFDFPLFSHPLPSIGDASRSSGSSS